MDRASWIGWAALAGWVVALGNGCGDDAPSRLARDAGEDAAAPLATECSSDASCDDGIYCNGAESCRAGRCVDGEAVTCDDGIACTLDDCSHATNSCQFVPSDADGDGHPDRSCLDPEGEPLGDDCDDADPDRYPGNVEHCDLLDPDHDEDCVDATFGTLDEDQDGVVDARCCAVGQDEVTRCGADCDDDNPSRFPEHPEICDGIDNDCDGEVDVGTEEVPWYVDADGDGYGNATDAPLESCAPLAGRSLRDTDCDDTRGAVHPAAREVCDELDNDCDEADDEGGVCDCAPVGGKQACACDSTSTGSQLCVDGAWSACDCTECVSGVLDCLGDLIPRECEAGRWTVHAACTGARPICLLGQCVCADGSTSCAEVEDVVAPFVFGISPLDETAAVPLNAVVSVAFSEQVKPSTVTAQTFYLRDGYGRDVPATLAVGTSSVTLAPLAPLLPGMAYSARVDAAITDLAGNALSVGTQWAFMTGPGLPVGEIAPPTADTFYNAPSLAMNAAGNALLVLDQGVQSGDIIVPAVVGTARISGTWLTPTVLMNAAINHPESVAMDDANTGFVQLPATGDTWSIFTFDGAAWTGTAPYGIDVSSLVDPPVAVEGSGYGLAIAEDPQGLIKGVGFRARAQNGVFAAASYSSVPVGSGDARADVAPGGYGAVGWTILSDDGLGLRHSVAGLTGWVGAPAYSFPGGTVNGQDVAVNASGQVLQVWAERQQDFGGGGGSVTQQRIAARLIGADNVQVGAVTLLVPFANGSAAAQPRVDFDASGNAIAVFRDAGAVYAVRYVPATGWGSPVQLSMDGSSGLGPSRLVVSANGSAVVAWTQEYWLDPGFKELWVARHTPGTGWGDARRISTPQTPVSSFDLAMDATGGSLVIWKETTYAGLKSASP
jgi:hypothetical protein